ncbi:MAG: tetratricopeptide repeat protein [Elusimicrobia bacterium]|nr:tetratricopeptide repeat protein [Elusimicrobiota bacterium]
MRLSARRRLSVALALLLGGAAPRAHAGAGTTAAEFLKVDNGGRPAGMGGAYAAAARDVTGGLYWNPGGLGLMRGHELAASYNAFAGGVSQGYLAYGGRFERLGGLALGLSYLDAGTQTMTEPSPDGGYRTVGSFTPSAWAVSAGWGRAFLEERAGIGVVVKELDETLWTGAGPQGDRDDGASAFALDAGVLGRFLDRHLSLGLAYQNLGTRLGGYELPSQLRGGAAWESGPFTGVLDILAPAADSLECRLGAEYVLAKTVALRLGFDSALGRGDSRSSRVLSSGFTTGVGLRLSAFSFDYALVPYGDLGQAHRAGLSWRWGAPRDARGRLVPEPAPAPRPVCPDESARPATPEDEETERRFREIDRLVAAGRPLDTLRALEYSKLGLSADDPRQVRYLERWGAVLYQTGNVSAAEFSFRDALRTAARLGVRGSAQAEAYVGLARCRLAVGDAAGARDMLRKALESCPSDRTWATVAEELRKLEGRKD